MTKTNNTPPTTENQTRRPCSKCGGNLGPSRQPHDPPICWKCEASIKLLTEARAKWGDRFDYSKEEENPRFFDLFLTCNACGSEFKINPTQHIDSCYGGCKECDRRAREAEFIEKARAKHGNRFTYDPATLGYKSLEKSITYLCPDHGTVTQKAINHLESATGCIKCGQEITTGWSRSDFIALCNRNAGRAVFYLIECQSRNERFIKCGITSKSTRERFNKSGAMPYSYKVLLEIEATPAEVYDLEKQVIRLNKPNHYTPRRPFGGSTLECFSTLTDEAAELLKL